MILSKLIPYIFLFQSTIPAWGGYSKAVAELRLGDFIVQDLANKAWAFATMSQQDVQLFAALARAAGWCVGDFHAQDLANTAWAFATLGQPDVKLFAALGRAAT